MKTVFLISVGLVLALALFVTAPRGEIEGAVHVGHTGDVRALCHVDGTLWIGTGGGFYRYDLGRDRFVDHVTVGEKLPSNSVRVIRERDGRVYVGTDAGLSIFDGAQTQVFSEARKGPYGSVPFEHIRNIDFGRGDVVYLGTFGRGVGVMFPRGGYAVTREDSLLDDKVYGTVEVARGVGEESYYYATSMGLCAFRDSTWINYQAGAGIPRGEVRRILPDGEGRYYLLVGVGGVYRFDGRQTVRLSPAGVFPGDDVADLTRDRRGILWAAGRFGGLAVYQKGQWKRIGEGDPMIDSGRWRCVHTDDEGGAFFGSADGLVVSVRDNILRKHRVPAQLPSASVQSIVAAPREVRFLSGSRVVRVPLDLSSLAVDDTPPGLTALAVDANGGVWASGRWGIYQGSEAGYREFVHDIDAPDPSFTTLCFDGIGRLWTATRAGEVYRYDGELWLRMAESGELFPGSVDKVVVEPARADGGGEVVWALARGRGVAGYGGGAWTVLATDTLGDVLDLGVRTGGVVAATPSRLWELTQGAWAPVGIDADAGLVVGDSVDAFVAPPSRRINCVRHGDDGALFLGTEKGLALLSARGVRWLGPADGLGGEAVVDVFVEGSEAVWIGFRSDGVTRVPLKSLW